MTNLYPLKFKQILKDKIWGGNRLKNILNKDPGNLPNIGESWEISAIPGELSIVANGELKGRNIEEVIQEFNSKLLGNKVFSKFGTQFPLLIKFIDANEYLSIQVHPDDEMAKERHNCYGKTEMWYVIDADKDAKLIAGFNQEMNKDKYLKQMNDGTLGDVLNFEEVKSGDVFFMPAGRIHATGPGILFAEIQQTSDITYRIYDWDRTDANGNSRELHTDLAIDAINYDTISEYKTKYNTSINKSNSIIECEFFTTNKIEFDSRIIKNYQYIDSFIVYMALNGSTKISYDDYNTFLDKGETILIPACIKEITLYPITGSSELLEVYIE